MKIEAVDMYATGKKHLKILFFTTLLMLLLILSSISTGGSTITVTPTATGIPTSTPTFAPSDIPAKTLPASPSADTSSQYTAPLDFPDRGIIKIDHYYDFQRVYDILKEPTYYHGVIFSPYVSTVPISGPVNFWYTVKFADGTEEQLQYVGLLQENQVIYEFTKHDYPRAGVMMAAHDVNGGIMAVIYLLVSE